MQTEQSWWIIWMAQLNQNCKSTKGTKATEGEASLSSTYWRSPESSQSLLRPSIRQVCACPDPDKMSWVDWLFFCFIGTQSEEIGATQTISQQLPRLRGFPLNTLEDRVPKHTRVRDIFAKSPSTNCLTISNGPHHWTCARKPRHSAPRVYPWPWLKRSNWMSSLMITSKSWQLYCWSHQWPLLSFFTKRREPPPYPGLPEVQHNDHKESLSHCPWFQISSTKVSEAKSKYFIKLDVHVGTKRCRSRMEMSWRWLFRWTEAYLTPVMFFSLPNSPMMFQTMMNDIFKELID